MSKTLGQGDRQLANRYFSLIIYVAIGAGAVLVTFISMLVSLYSRPFVKDEDWLHVGGYYTLFGLLTVGLSGMIITGDVFNLYVYLEIMSLSGYALIALGGRKSMLAAFRYLLIGTIGASLYLLGVGYLYAMTGTLNMADLAQLIIPHLHSPLFAMAVACFLIGFGIKMALFPLHGWQPDADFQRLAALWGIFTWQSGAKGYTLAAFADAKLLLILAVSFLLCGPLQALRPKLKEALYARKAPSLAGAAGLLVLLFFGLMRVTAGTYSAFIYFQF